MENANIFHELYMNNRFYQIPINKFSKDCPDKIRKTMTFFKIHFYILYYLENFILFSFLL